MFINPKNRITVMQSQRTARRPESGLGEVVPSIAPPADIPVVISGRSAITEEENSRLSEQLDLEIHTLSGARPAPASIRAQEASMTMLIQTLANIPQGERIVERNDPEQVERFVLGRAQFLTLVVPQDDAYKQETLRQFSEMLLAPPGEIPHYAIMRDPEDPSVITIRNNWFIPFSEEDREKLARYLSESQNLDSNTKAQVLDVYLKLFELAKKTYALYQTEAIYGGVAGDVIRELISSYETLESQVFSAFDALLEGSGNAETLLRQAATLAEDADSLFENAYFRLARGFEAYDPAPAGSELRRAIDRIRNPSGAWAEELSFSPVERQIFEGVFEQYNSALGRIREKSHDLAALLLGYFPGQTLQLPSHAVTVGSLSEEDLLLFRHFASICGTLQLFVAKANFLDIQAEYAQYESFLREVEPDAGSAEEILDSMALRNELPSDVAAFRANKERYERELAKLYPQLLAYGEYISKMIVMNSPNLTMYFGESQKKEFFVPLLALRESRPAVPEDIHMAMDASTRYLQTLHDNMESLFARASEIQQDWDLQARFREGGFWDKAYAFSKYFLKERGTEFLVLSTILTAGGGLIAGGVRGAAWAARAGFAAAATATAPMAAIVLGDAISHLGEEGSAGLYAQEDLRIATQFLLCGGMAWAGGTGMVSRIFSNAAFGLADVSTAISVADDVRKGDILSALADSVVFAAGGYMFIRGISGIRALRLSEPLDSTRMHVGGPFGIQELQLPRAVQWVTFPYTGRGVSEFFMGTCVLEPLFNPEEVAQALASDYPLDALRSYFNETYLQYAYTFPAANLLLEGAIFPAGRAALRRLGLAVRRPPSVVYDAAGAQALQVPVSDPQLMAAAATAGAGDNALLIAREMGINLEDMEAVRRVYSIALGDARLSADEVFSLLSPFRPNSVSEREFRNLASRMAEDTASIWESSRKLLYGGELPASERRSISRVFRDAVRNNRRLIQLGLGGLAIGAISWSTALRDVPYYQELYRAQQSMQPCLDNIANSDSARWFLGLLIRGDFLGFSRESPLSAEQQELFLNSATIVANRIEGSSREAPREGYEWAEVLRTVLPGPQDRFNLVYAASLALSSYGLSDPEDYLQQLENLVGNLAYFFRSQPEMSWQGMRIGDFFLAANYFLRINDPEAAGARLEELVSHFRSNFTPYTPGGLYDATLRAHDMIGRTSEAIADPSFARVAISVLYQSAFGDKPENWAESALLSLYNAATEDENYRLHPSEFFSRYYGEMLVEVLGAPAFAPDAPAPHLGDLTNLFIAASRRFPFAVYYPETRRFFRE